MVWPGEGINKLVIKPGNQSAGAPKWSKIRSIIDILCHKHTVQKPTSTEPLHCLAFLAQQRGEESNHIYLLFIFTLLN